MTQSEREHIERKVRAYPPVLFVFIGVAIGMVLTVILLAIALVPRGNFQHKLSRLLEL